MDSASLNSIKNGTSKRDNSLSFLHFQLELPLFDKVSLLTKNGNQWLCANTIKNKERYIYIWYELSNDCLWFDFFLKFVSCALNKKLSLFTNPWLCQVVLKIKMGKIGYLVKKIFVFNMKKNLRLQFAYLTV